MTTKSIVAELTKGDKLNDDNYDIWCRKIQFVMYEQQALDTLDSVLPEPERPQIRQEQENYQSWQNKDQLARYTMQASIQDDLISEFENYSTTHAMWKALKEKFGITSVVRLRGLTIGFDSYQKKPEHTMKQHLRAMTTMICDLSVVGHVLTNEQNVSCRLELEAKHLEATKGESSPFVVKVGSPKTFLVQAQKR